MDKIIPYKHPLNEFVELYVLDNYLDEIHHIKVEKGGFVHIGPDQWMLAFTMNDDHYLLLGSDFIDTRYPVDHFGKLLPSEALDDFQIVPKRHIAPHEHPYISEAILDDDTTESFVPEDSYFHQWGTVHTNTNTQRTVPYQYYPIITDSYCLLKYTMPEDRQAFFRDTKDPVFTK